MTVSCTTHSQRPGRLLAGLAVAVLAIVLAGCGTRPAPGPGTGGGTHGTSPASAKVDLVITFSGGRGIRPAHFRLRCDPPGGTHPRPAAACQALLAMHRPFAPRKAGVACPMIMGAGGRIVVTGTWFGEPVHRIIVDGGCDIGLFGSLRKILL